MIHKSNLNIFLFAFSIVILFGVTACKQGISFKEAQSLTLSEGFINPLGFYDSKPTFSWKLPVSDNIKSQSAYQIVVASSKELLPQNPDLWDSKKQESSQSTFVKFQGKDLESRQKVFWQVRFWDQDKNQSEWSEISTFELGLLNNSDWNAKWTGLDTAKDSIRGVRNFLMHRPQYLRKRFNLNNKVSFARLYITAKGVFDAHINGKDLSNDILTPGWTPYNHRIETLTYDVTEFLRKGENALAVELASGWHSGRISRGKAPYKKFTSPKLLCQLEITMKDGSKQIVVSDQTWKGTTNGPIRLASIYDGETYDANFEMPNWTTTTFNDASWRNPEIQDLSEHIKLEPKRHLTVKNKQVLNDVAIVDVKNNTAIFNLKQNIVGVPKVKVPMKKGDTLKIRFSEMLLSDNTFYTTNYRSAKSTDFYIAAKDGSVEYTPKFTFHGFQYVELSGYDKTATPNETWIQGLVQHSNFDKNGTFTSSHKKLNQLQSNITWGLRGNFFDIPTDCPQRDERLGWTGDAQVIAPTALYNFKTHAFWTAWLQSLRENQSEHENGMVPFIVPDVLQNKKASPGWGDAVVLIPWSIYNITGDKRVLEDNFEAAKKWIGFYKSKVENSIPKMASFGDWLQPYPAKEGKSGNSGDTSKKLIITAYFAHSSLLVSKMAGLLGHTDDEKEYLNLHKNISKVFRDTFFDENGKVTNSKETQTSYLLAIYFNLLEPEIQLKAQKQLLELIKKADNHLGTGFLGTPLLPKVLDEMGEIDLMYSMLFKETYPSWFYSINQGATTMWERWNSYSKSDGYNPQSMNSLNHYAYGAVGQWMYERIAGIAPLEPGYKKIRIAPVPNTEFLNSASASLNTPYGKASSTWNIENDSYNLQALIPPNVTADIYLYNTSKNEVLLNGKLLQEESYLKIKELTDKTIVVTVDAGTYQFQTKLR